VAAIRGTRDGADRHSEARRQAANRCESCASDRTMSREETPDRAAQTRSAVDLRCSAGAERDIGRAVDARRRPDWWTARAEDCGRSDAARACGSPPPPLTAWPALISQVSSSRPPIFLLCLELKIRPVISTSSRRAPLIENCSQCQVTSDKRVSGLGGKYPDKFQRFPTESSKEPDERDQIRQPKFPQVKDSASQTDLNAHSNRTKLARLLLLSARALYYLRR
jgi:hypothetical protein